MREQIIEMFLTKLSTIHSIPDNDEWVLEVDVQTFEPTHNPTEIEQDLEHALASKLQSTHLSVVS